MSVIKNNFDQAAEKLTLMKSLDTLARDLQKLGPVPSDSNIYKYGIDFFNTVLSFTKKYPMSYNIADVFNEVNQKKDVHEVAEHIRQTSYECSFISGKEPVTSSNLYIDVEVKSPKMHERWYKRETALFWSTLPQEKTALLNEEAGIDVKKAAQQRLSDFIKAHREPMIKSINTLLDNNKTSDFIAYQKQQAKGM